MTDSLLGTLLYNLIGGQGILLLLLLVLYFVPALVATITRHRNAGAICALNTLLGWTVLGWVGALVWALTASTPEGDL